MKMFNPSQQDRLKEHIIAIKKSSLGGTPESNEHLRLLLGMLKKKLSTNSESQIFKECQEATALLLKSNLGAANKRAELLAQAMNRFDVAINLIPTELKKDSVLEASSINEHRPA